MCIYAVIDILGNNQVAKDKLLGDLQLYLDKTSILMNTYRSRYKKELFSNLAFYKYRALKELYEFLSSQKLYYSKPIERRNYCHDDRSVKDIILSIDEDYPCWREGFVSHRIDDFVVGLLKFEANLGKIYAKYVAELEEDPCANSLL